MIKEVAPYNLLNSETSSSALESIDNKLSDLFAEVSAVLIYSRIDDLPEDVIDLLAHQFHIEGYDTAKSISEKRGFVKNAILLHRYKGTKWAIKKVLEIIGLDGDVKEWFETGDEPYTFSVSLSGEISDDTPIARLVELINEYKNVRSKLNRLDFTAIKQLEEIFVNSFSCLHIELFDRFLRFFESLQSLKVSLIASVDFGRDIFEIEPISESITASSLTNYEPKENKDLPFEDIYSAMMPSGYMAILQLNDEGESSVFVEYFKSENFVLFEEARLIPANAAVLRTENEQEKGFVAGVNLNAPVVVYDTILSLEV